MDTARETHCDELPEYRARFGRNNTDVENKRLKICVAASPGGHMVQARSFESIYARHDYFYFTFSGEVADRMGSTERVISIPNIYRRKPLSVLMGILLSCYHAIKERPDVVITTGASVVFFFCLAAKCLGSRVVFLESVANVERPTLTGRLLYPVSDLFLVQWPQLLRYYPRASYYGRLF